MATQDRITIRLASPHGNGAVRDIRMDSHATLDDLFRLEGIQRPNEFVAVVNGNAAGVGTTLHDGDCVSLTPRGMKAARRTGSWVDEFVGAFRDDPDFNEISRLGREFRESVP